MTVTVWTLLGSVLLLASVVMTIAFLVALKLRCFSIVDIVWAYLFAPSAALCVWLGSQSLRAALLAAMLCLWSVRLGTHLLTRIAHHYPKEDTRYDEMRRTWSKNLYSKFFVFYQFQAMSVAALILPVAIVSLDPNSNLTPWHLFATALWIVGLAGESTADAQLRRFVKNPSHRGKICDIGLWRYSRHPNYFFESTMWMAYGIYALGSPQGYWALLAPACILYLLIKVTGLPPSEEQSLQTFGDAFRSYQRRTSAFIPWFPRQESSHVG